MNARIWGKRGWGSIFNGDRVSVWTDEVRKMAGDDDCMLM